VKIPIGCFLFLTLSLVLLAGCGGSSTSTTSNPAPLSANNLNLIFVVSSDLAYQTSGDISPTTANLTSQGLQRSLQMATFLKNDVLGTENVSSISALEPMTHLQTAENYPDMVAITAIQQFAQLNQVTVSSTAQGFTPLTAYSYPINVTYGYGTTSSYSGVAAPVNLCPACQGLDFTDLGSDNENLATGIIQKDLPGFYVFSAPWETTKALLTSINRLEGYNLTLPSSYQGANTIYAIAISLSGSARLVTYNSNLSPSSTYPTLPTAVPTLASCSAAPIDIELTGGVDNAVIPPGTNTNETIYFVRHVEAHPNNSNWEDGSYVGSGQWRALDLPYALSGKIAPDQVWSVDPAQVIPGTQNINGDSYWSYVRPALTAEPYAIANNLPFNLAADIALASSTAPESTSEFFTNGGTFSNHKLLVAWEHNSIVFAIKALLASYLPAGSAQLTAADAQLVWASPDYDSIWTLTLDSQGNLTVKNNLCEGIDSAELPDAPPQF
jgi:hypothetical protein